MGCWGPDLFQSDHDYDIVSELTHEAGVYDLENAERAKASAGDEIHYSLYAPLCTNVPAVRQHLDGGVLEKLITEKEKSLAIVPKDPLANFGRDPCYVLVLLGACAMTLGCKLPDSYLTLLKKMKKALFGSNGYKNGEPYDFESKDLVQTANSMEDEGLPTIGGFQGMNMPGPGGLFSTGMGDSESSKIIKEFRAIRNGSKTCGGCGVITGPDGAALLRCGKCKERRYCTVQCQKKHWKLHKMWCQTKMD
ncbi:hypothetical protein BU24DRAFT_439880 [Aaosphaeria arxii CBS 175.79]|uniref:MYND-type domain-containing protein n=1 Tax=Aaosphaeria arxii CBS 175.79 TaxID=1450172 RepID=A0A6A5Y5C3_9PLEO|nr:uncharacterized protein BU24DRAFT_439880 [Aaosphaeria arxii CBS 175.79]KAF2019980.1 hypothetical protein BU24DRAFT_439880 [Aaosphaeria arxii CBS 175.79]